MLTMLTLALLINLILFSASHPVLIMIMVIAQTLMVCLMVWLISSTAWIPFILFLIFIGGLMVLFIYITSLAANEKMNNPLTPTKSQLIMVSYSLAILILMSYFYPTKMYSMVPLVNQVELIFSQLLSPVTLIIMVYLLITLIVAVSVSKKMEGPLRNLMKSK